MLFAYRLAESGSTIKAPRGLRTAATALPTTAV